MATPRRQELALFSPLPESLPPPLPGGLAEDPALASPALAPAAALVARLRAELPRGMALGLRSGAEMVRLAEAAQEEMAPRAVQVPVLDRVLGGGLPRGRLVELVARSSAGRFAAALSALAAVTSTGEPAALVDLGDHLDPAAAAAAGVELPLLLWLRPRRAKDAVTATEILLAAGFPLVVLDLGLPPLRGRVTDAAWVRLARAAEAQHAALLVSVPYRSSGPAAEAVVLLEWGRGRWVGEGNAPRLLEGIDARLTVAKRRGDRPGTVAAMTARLDESFAPASGGRRRRAH